MYPRKCQPGTFPVHVAFDAMLFSDLKRGASVARASPEKREVRDCCSSDLFVFDVIERER